MESFMSKPMAKKMYELYHSGKIDEHGLQNAVSKNWISQEEADEIREAAKSSD